jgi:hypothetical protein
LFPLSLSVPQYQFDRTGISQKSFNSYPVQQNVQNLVGVYRRPPGGGPPQFQGAGEHPLMRLARLTGVTEEEHAAAHAKVYRLKQRNGTLRAAHAFQAEDLHPDAVNFILMDQYYSGLAQGARNRFVDHGSAPVVPPVLDFQQALSAFGRFPNLLRALGLILDFTVPAASLAAAATDDKLWLAPVVTSGAFAAAFSSWTHTPLSTAYHLDRSSRSFLIRTLPPSDPNGVSVGVDSGMLSLPETDFTVTPVDLDHLAYNTRGVLQQIRRQLSNGIEPDAIAIRPPAARSSGFLFARSELAACIQTILADQAALNAAIEANPGGVEVEVGAEQLLRGVRVDISSDGGQTWLSLCKRAVTHTPDSGAAPISYEDEGCVPLKLFNPDLTTASAPLWTHESLFRWSGWSLCVPRPGLAIQDGSTLVGDDDQGSSNLPVKTKVTPPAAGHTLPRLRYGVTYVCRLRAVDLAGNGLSLNSAIDPGFNVPLGAYLRFDPISSPALLLKQPTGPGEFVDCIVIHSDFNSPSIEIDERYIAPPKTSIECALWHGALDAPSGVDASAYKTLVELDGAFSDVPYGAVPPSLPYLPDPIARGASFDLEPGVQQPQSIPLQASFSGTWPRLQGIRLLLQEGSGGPVLDVANGALTFNLLKSQTRQLNLACFASPADFPSFDYIAQFRNQQSVLTLAEQSRLPQLTPPRLLTLVHAVQRPLAAPLLQLQAFRSQTTATLEGVIAIHGASTGSVDFFGSWQEPLDDGINAPSTNSFASRVARANPAVTDSSIAGFTHHLNDTKYRRVTYWAIATTRFLEYFPKSVTDDPAQITQTSNLSVVDVPCSAPPPAPKVLYAIPTFGWTKTNTANSITHQRRCGVRVYLDRPWYLSGDGELLGVVVATMFTPPPTGSGGDGGGDGGGGGTHPFTNGGADVAIRPHNLPEITGISPNQGGLAGGDTVTITGVRFTGLRSVAFGTNGAQSFNLLSDTEITAVSPAGVGAVDVTVTTARGTSDTTDADEFTYPPMPAPNMDPQLAPFVTQWGADPAFAGADMPAGVSPIPVNFPNQAQSISAAFLTDAGGVVSPSRMVALFDVKFEPPDPANPMNPADPGKTPHNGRWYADIEIDSGGAYYPFLRLALVRCQLNGTGASPSPGGLTSPAVLADVVQIAPDRTTSMSFDPVNPDHAVLTVSGPSYAANNTSDSTQRPAAQVLVDIQVNIGTMQAPAWIQSSSSQLLVQDTSRGLASCVWTGAITLPAAIGSTPMRITLREEELLPVDGGQTDVSPIGLASRLVFADSFEIGASEPPAITGITPAAGGAGGGTAVTITGTGFQGLTGVARVSFGSSPAEHFEVISDTQIKVTSPPGSGSVGITVTTGAGAVTGPSDSFTYVNTIPVVSNVFPVRASAQDQVTLTGSGFTGMTSVHFGADEATSFNQVSDTLATAVVPAGRGTVDITVTTPGGASSTGSADQFTFGVSAPVITSVSPKSGSASGGDAVTLTGSGFTGVSGIEFGSFTPSSFSFLSDSEIIVVTGSGQGAVSITVIAAGGVSANDPAAQFTFE